MNTERQKNEKIIRFDVKMIVNIKDMGIFLPINMKLLDTGGPSVDNSPQFQTIFVKFDKYRI